MHFTLDTEYPITPEARYHQSLERPSVNERANLQIRSQALSVYLGRMASQELCPISC